MVSEDKYKTIKSVSEGVFKDKGSKFIAYAFPFDAESNIKPILSDLKSLHPKARHFCWAYHLGLDKNNIRINDDGEPSGSAGRPIANTLLSTGLTNIMVVVVRYFGGTLLGVPGLINAYKSATLEAINDAVIIEKLVCDVYEITFPYEITNLVMKVIKEDQLSILSQRYDILSAIQIEIRKAKVEMVLSKLRKIEGLDLIFITTT